MQKAIDMTDEMKLYRDETTGYKVISCQQKIKCLEHPDSVRDEMILRRTLEIIAVREKHFWVIVFDEIIKGKIEPPAHMNKWGLENHPGDDVVYWKPIYD